MARSRSQSPVRSRRHGGSSSSRRGHHDSSSRRNQHHDVLPASSEKKEITLSIEETNELRRSLGLKPLVLGLSKKEQAIVNVQTTLKQYEMEREQKEIQRKVQHSKTRRELTQKLQGESLGEQLQATWKAQNSGETPLHDALKWVKESRKREKKEKASESVEKERYDAQALAGMTVGHAMDEFQDGKDVILTLKDQEILEDGKELNEHDDVLVNVEMSERERRKDREERTKRAALPVYSAYDDEEFLEVNSRRKRKITKILTQYDEDEEAREVEASRKFQLNAFGESQSVVKENIPEENEVAVISLSMNRMKRVEDYYTKDEMATQFAKRSKSIKKRKKKTLRRHKTVLDDDMEVLLKEKDDDEIESRDLVAQLESEAMKTNLIGSNDRGKRKQNDKKDEVDVDKLQRFQDAREKANAVAAEALAANSKSSQKLKRRRMDENELMDDAMEMERELGASLARVRQLTKEKVKPVVLTSEERIAELVSQRICHEENRVSSLNTSDNTLDGSEHKQIGQVFGGGNLTENAVVFNEATDFETRLRDAMEKRAAQFQAEAEKSMSFNGSNIETRQKGQSEKPKESDDEDEERKENEVWGEEEPLVGAGMAATLALLRQTGDLKQTRIERQAGRANDVRDRTFDADLRIKNGVKLDYRDEFGRLLTKKEAFRMLSYKFHGHEPGKRKKEKRLRQYLKRNNNIRKKHMWFFRVECKQNRLILVQLQQKETQCLYLMKCCDQYVIDWQMKWMVLLLLALRRQRFGGPKVWTC
ncbi:U4/U6.U5 snRNP associated protein [Plasmopara halstedii]|uniref:U4/U6.U5 snRNP associated protein n=1 Tax=Plasmopara halstedii TaxID=4781 RepID=A0A0P1ATF7_PLAHL|nr:U4/U6.U5 snRNP associated protein [Plasmopara halstedii]CEG44017.1 U4/U6.U5 snRNP associated protein [Plasmopara halstedii]|eukprot:XP_024580386.1 U4/U6.U5 snRNP associated protein [Plasmopara halstedii]